MSKTVEEMSNDINVSIEAIKSQLDKAVSVEDLTALKNELEANKEEASTELKNLLNEVSEKVSKLEESTTGKPKVSKTFGQEVAEKMEDIKAIAKGQNKTVVIKADVTRASITGNTASMRLEDIGQLSATRPTMYDVLPKIQVPDGNNSGIIKYVDWDEDTSVRSAGMVAEGGVFPESTAVFQEYSVPLRKVGDTLPVTEEFGTDEVTASGELALFLDTNVKSEVGNQVVNGDGTGQNLTGMVNVIPAFTPVASGISDANIYDLVTKMRTAITINRGSKYAPNFIAMNSNTLDLLHLKKDANDNYIFPDKMSVGSMMIIEDNNVADNTLFVGDSRYARIYEKSGVEISRGMVDAQFTSDLMTIKARKRLLFLIRNVDRTGFLECTDIATALSTLATP